jgi:putative heme-binding domain-containing protein
VQSIGPHSQRILHGLNPGSPKYCGLEIISGRHFPDDWQGDLITNDFRGHRVCRFKLQPDGSTYTSREQSEVIKSNHPAFRPIDVKLGPDGALYIADWYNPIIQHGEVDFRDPRRDKTHGRIWRVTAKGRPLVTKPKLADATVPELLERLKDPEQWTRQQAKRVLKERGKDKVLPELEKWLENLNSNDARFESRNLEAMWLVIGMHDIDVNFGTPNLLYPILGRLVKSKSPDTRAMAARALGQHVPIVGRPYWYAYGELGSLSEDENPRVRSEAVRGIAGLKSAKAVEEALRALHKPMDRVLDYALWLTVRELEPYWMPEFKAGKLTFGGDPKKLAFALNAVGTKDAIKPVIALLDSGKVPKDNLHGLYLLLARIGGAKELQKVLNQAASDPGITDRQRDELVAGVEEAIRTRKIPPPEAAPDLSPLLAKKGDTLHATMRIAGLWKLNRHARTLSIAVDNSFSTREDRRAALDGLVAMGGMWLDIALLGADNKSFNAAVRLDTIVALASVKLPAAAQSAASYLTEAKPSDDLLDLYSAFISRKGGAAALAKALAGKKLAADVAKIGVRAVKAAAARDAGPLEAALTKAGNLGAARKPPTPDEVKTLTEDVLKLGDPARGEAVFRRKELQCLACHAIGGAGGQVGPDLTSIGASAQPDYLVESLLLPNKAVKEGYHALRVVTVQDQVFLGRPLREANGQLVLLTPEDKQITIPTADIVERGQTKSLMPESLTDSLTKQEFADLARFLSELGKIGPYAPSKARVVRRWQWIEPTPANMNLARRTRLAAAAEAGTPFAWSPIYAKTSGDLPVADLPKIVVWSGNDPLAVVRFQLDATTAGAAKLRFNNPAGLTAYLDGKPLDVRAETPLDLKVGTATVTLVIDRVKRTDDVRVELDDAAGSPARVSVVGGK